MIGSNLVTFSVRLPPILGATGTGLTSHIYDKTDKLIHSNQGNHNTFNHSCLGKLQSSNQIQIEKEGISCLYLLYCTMLYHCTIELLHRERYTSLNKMFLVTLPCLFWRWINLLPLCSFTNWKHSCNACILMLMKNACNMQYGWFSYSNQQRYCRYFLLFVMHT